MNSFNFTADTASFHNLNTRSHSVLTAGEDAHAEKSVTPFCCAICHAAIVSAEHHHHKIISTLSMFISFCAAAAPSFQSHFQSSMIDSIDTLG